MEASWSDVPSPEGRRSVRVWRKTAAASDRAVRVVEPATAAECPDPSRRWWRSEPRWPSPLSRRPGQDAFGVVRVQARSLSLVAGRGVRLPHTAAEVATRPTSCTSPAQHPATTSAGGHPATSAASWASTATARRAAEVDRAQVGEVGERLERPVDPVLVKGAVRRRLAGQHDVPRLGGVEQAEQLVGAGEERLDRGRREHRPVPRCRRARAASAPSVGCSDSAASAICTTWTGRGEHRHVRRPGTPCRPTARRTAGCRWPSRAAGPSAGRGSTRSRRRRPWSG